MPTSFQTPTQKSAQKSAQKSGRRRIAGERRPREEAAPATTPPSSSTPSRSSKRPRSASRTAEPSRPAPTGDRPSRWMLAVAAVLLVGVLVEATLLVRSQLQAAEAQQRAETLDSALTAAPARAKEATTALLSYSHDSIDKDIARTTPFLTPGYAKDYTSTMRDVVAEPAKETKATVTAEVLSTAVVDAGAERTDVLVFVNQVTESTTGDEPRTALNRAILTMVQRDGAWVVSGLKGL